jgi:tRNA nucleotidyltransferase (CCA-adding enzyme)
MIISDASLRIVYAAVKKTEGLGPGELSKEDMAKQTTAIEIFLNRIIRTKLPEYKDKIFAVGGFVRDRLLGKNPNDLDIVVDNPEDGIESAKIFAKKLADVLGITTSNNPYTLKEKFKVWGLVLVYPVQSGGSRPPLIAEGVDVSGYLLDISPPRKESSYPEDAREPESIEYATREEDAVRRDLTVNAIYKNISGQNLENSSENIEDYTGGIDDLNKKTLRKPSHPSMRDTQIYEDDPLRIFRLVRFKGKLDGFNIDPETEKTAKKFIKSDRGHNLMNWKVKKDRVRDELSSILTIPDGAKAAEGLERAKEYGLLKYISPELDKMIDVFHDKVYHRGESVWEHTMDVLKSTPPTIKARLSALFHDVGKVYTREEKVDSKKRQRVHFVGHENVGARLISKILAELRYPGEMIDSITNIAHAHMGFKMLNNMTPQEKTKKIRIFIEKLFHDVDDAISLLKADIVHVDDPAKKAKGLAEMNKLEQEIKAQIKKDMDAGLIMEKNIGHPEYIYPLKGSEIQQEYKKFVRENIDRGRQYHGKSLITDEEFEGQFKELQGIALGHVSEELRNYMLSGVLGEEDISEKAKKKIKDIISGGIKAEQLIQKQKEMKGKPKSFYS